MSIENPEKNFRVSVLKHFKCVLLNQIINNIILYLHKIYEITEITQWITTSNLYILILISEFKFISPLDERKRKNCIDNEGIMIDLLV